MEENKYTMPVKKETKEGEPNSELLDEISPLPSKIDFLDEAVTPNVVPGEGTIVTASVPMTDILKENISQVGASAQDKGKKKSEGKTTIQVSMVTKTFLDALPGKNYDEKVEYMKDNWRAEEKRIIDDTVAPIIRKIDLIK